MTHNSKEYKWYNSCNNNNFMWGLHCKDGHKYWSSNTGKKDSVLFSGSDIDRIIYLSYLAVASEESTEEEKEDYRVKMMNMGKNPITRWCQWNIKIQPFP